MIPEENRRRAKSPVIIKISPDSLAFSVVFHPAKRPIFRKLHIGIHLFLPDGYHAGRKVHPFYVLRPGKLQIREYSRRSQLNILHFIKNRPVSDRIEILPVQKSAKIRKKSKTQQLCLLTRIPEHPKLIHRVIKFIRLRLLIPRRNVRMPLAGSLVP